jgi:DNA polymerase-3 subunit delta
LLHLFFGDDEVGLERTVGEIAAKVDPALSAVNIQRLDGSGADLGQLAAACCSLPFLGNSRVIIVRRLGERLRAAPKEAAAFAEALRSMPPSTELVLIEPDLQGDGSSHPLYGLARQIGEARQFSLGSREDIEDWVAERAAERGLALTREACVELARRVGAHALMIETELDKIGAYALGRPQVDARDVRELVPATEESDVFDLVDAIGHRDSGRALSIVQDLMLRQAEPAQRLLPMIARQFRLLLIAKDLTAARLPPAQLAAELDAPSWRARRLVEQSRYFSIAELERALGRALEADYATKGGGDAADIVVMTQLVADLTAGS